MLIWQGGVLQIKSIPLEDFGTTIFDEIKIQCKNKAFKHVKVKYDNTAAISSINQAGGQKSEDCNSIAKEIWEWCIERNLWISTVHIPGCNNVEGDLYSRELESTTQQQLNLVIFKNIIKTFGTQIQTYLPVELTSSYQNLFHGIQNQRRGPQMPFLWCGSRCTFTCFFLLALWEGIVKGVQGENSSHNYHTKLAIPKLVPSNIIPSHSGTGV